MSGKDTKAMKVIQVVSTDFSVVDVVGALTDQPTPKRASTYWAVLKGRLKEEGADELLTTCKQLNPIASLLMLLGQ